MSDNPPLLRQWLLLKTLSGRHCGVTVAEMAEELGVTEKTIRRDLKAFCEVGFPIEEQIGDRSRKSWRLKSAGGLPEMSFALDEALALYLGRRFLEPLAGTFLWQAAESVEPGFLRAEVIAEAQGILSNHVVELRLARNRKHLR